MKRKSPSANTLEINQDVIKPQLKKIKTNITPNSVKSSNSNVTINLISNSKENISDTSVDRYLDGLIQSEKTAYTLKKDDLMYTNFSSHFFEKNLNRNNEESKICKNLNETTYKEASTMGSGERSNKGNLHGLKDLKDVRKLVKLNKLDDTTSQVNNAFHTKISNKLGIQINPGRGTLAQQREVVKRAIKESQEQTLRAQEAANLAVNGHSGNGVQENMKEPEPMIVENTGIQQLENQGMNGQMEGLAMNFEEQSKIEMNAGTMFAKRDPRENRWHNKQNVNKENMENKNLNNKTSQIGMLTRSRQQERAFTKPESKTPKTVRVVPAMSGDRTRGSSVASNESSAQRKSGSALSCRSEPPVNKTVKKMNFGTKSAGRVEKTAVARIKGKEVGGLRLMNSEEKPKKTSTVLSGSVIKIREENEVLKKDLDKQREEIDEMSKENGELVRRLEAIETEKMRLLREINNKQEYLTDKEVEIEGIRKQLILSEFYRTNLHNYIQDLRGNLRIFCKVKPIKCLSKGMMVSYPQKTTLEVEDTPSLSLKSLEIGNNAQNKSIFYFDRVFDETSTQESVFEEILPFIQSAVDGEKVCILAYGQTGSGKTYTMEGPNLDQAKSITHDSGILPRAVDFIFREIKRLEVQNNNIELQMSCMEIYNENLTDLLAAPETNIIATTQQNGNNQLNNNKNKLKEKEKEKDKDTMEVEKDNKLIISFVGNRVVVNGLTWVPIKDNQQLFALVSRASKTRVTASTSWNEKSSRSHCIYRLKLIRSDGKEGLLNIVDLAGSERADSKSFEDKSAMEISRMKKVQAEANYINKSLTTLGRILRLISEKKSENVIPYRESKLTRILQDSLGGNGKTLMFINICPSEENLFQSKESLKFSVKACL